MKILGKEFHIGKPKAQEPPKLSDQEVVQRRLAQIKDTLAAQQNQNPSGEVYKTPPSPQELWQASRGKTMDSEKPVERTMANEQLASALPQTEETTSVPAKPTDKAA